MKFSMTGQEKGDRLGMFDCISFSGFILSVIICVQH